MSKEQKRQAFYTQSPEEVLQAVDATEQGLSSSEAEKRLAEFGHNELEEGEKRSILVKFIEQFKDLMIIILVAAAILSVVTSGGEDIADAIIILAVVIINAAFGVYQEGKAEEAIEALKSMSSQLPAFFVMDTWQRLTLKNWYQAISLPLKQVTWYQRTYV